MHHLTSDEISNLKKQIFEYLVENCCGYNQAKPRSLMLTYLQNKGVNISDRGMRSLIHEMIDDNYLVGCGEGGYYLIDSPADLGKAIAYLEAKAQSISIRKNELTRNFHSHFQDIADKQLDLLRGAV
jgi:hypothetical protein